MNRLILLFVLLLPMPALAEEITLILGSYHISRGNSCEFNPGILYESQKRILVGAYMNSGCKMTLVFGKTVWRSDDYEIAGVNTRFKLPVGVALFGYEESLVLPFLLPTMDINVTNNVAISLSIIPTTKPIFGIGINYQF